MGWGGFYTWGGGLGIPVANQTATAPPIQSLLEAPNPRFNFVLEGAIYRAAGEATIYYAWQGLNTTGSDTPANQRMPELLTVPINWQTVAPLTASGGTASGGFGTVEFVADEDDDLSASWAGRAFDLKLGGSYGEGAGVTTLTYAQYVARWKFIATDITYNEDSGSLIVRDALASLDKPIQQARFGDTVAVGAAEKFQPIVYGRPFNIPAVLHDESNNIYRLSSSALASVTSVKVNGLSLTNAGDTTNLPAWVGGSAGQFKTNLLAGNIRLWATPDGEVTVDCQRSELRPGIVLRDMIEDAGVTDIDEGSFHAYPHNETANSDIGIYIGTNETNALQILQQAAAGLDAWLYTNRAGQVTLGRHGNPLLDNPVYTLEGRDDGDGPNVVVSIQRLPVAPCPSEIKALYKRNFAPLSEQELDATLSVANRALMSTEMLETDAHDNSGATTVTPSSTQVIIDTPFRNVAGANALIGDIASRIGEWRELFELEIVAPMFVIDPGMIVCVKHDRFNLSGGRNGEVISVVETADSTVLQVLMVQ